MKPVTYKAASAEVKKRFLKGGGNLGHFSKKDEKEKEDDRGVAPEQQTELLEGPFAIVDPIDTIVGPIGKFIMEPENFPMHPSVILFGKRRTGKTFTLRDIMYHCFRDIPFGICMTGTSYNGFWQEYIPANLVFQGLRPEMMQKIIERQKRIIKRFQKEHPGKDYKSEPNLRAFIIFDDCIADRAAMIWNKELNEFFVLGRHLLISVFITTQHVKGLGPMLRGNADVVCLQPIFQHEARITLADLYGGFMDRNAFVELMDEIVYDRNLPDSTPQDPKKEVRTMFINDYENTTNPQMKFKWYMAEDPGPFKLCAPEYWKAQQNSLDLNGGSKLFVNDPVDELDQIQRLQDFRFE